MDLKEIFKKLKPRNYTCDICGREVFAGERICKPCCDTLPWITEPRCPICGRAEKVEGVCIECKSNRPLYQKARSLFRHEGEAARLVLRYKNGEKFLSETIAELFASRLKEFEDVDALTYVPMTRKAQRARGYNQTYLLAKRLSEESGIELLSALEKVRDTEAQKTLGRRERLKNLEGCFRVTDRKSVRAKTILLIDDTLTTGATSHAIIEQLLKAHAKKVYLLSVTSVPNRAEFEEKSRKTK